jgi:hypothetical protein
MTVATPTDLFFLSFPLPPFLFVLILFSDIWITQPTTPVSGRGRRCRAESGRAAVARAEARPARQKRRGSGVKGPAGRGARGRHSGAGRRQAGLGQEKGPRGQGQCRGSRCPRQARGPQAGQALAFASHFFFFFLFFFPPHPPNFFPIWPGPTAKNVNEGQSKTASQSNECDPPPIFFKAPTFIFCAAYSSTGSTPRMRQAKTCAAASWPPSAAGSTTAATFAASSPPGPEQTRLRTAARILSRGLSPTACG